MENQYYNSKEEINEKLQNDKFIKQRVENISKDKENFKGSVETSLFLEAFINSNEELEKLHDESMKIRYQKLEKNKNKTTKNIQKRTKKIAGENYPKFEMALARKKSKIIIAAMKDKKLSENLDLYIEGKKATVEEVRKMLDDYSSNPKMFIPTHVCIDDIIMMYRVVNKHMALLSGAEERMLGTFNGEMLKQIGTNFVDRSVKQDRTNANIKIKKDLEQGIDQLWYVEGTHNLSPNQILTEFSYKYMQIALETSAYLVPVGIYHNPIDSDKKMSMNFHRAYLPNKKLPIEELHEEFKEKLATLKHDLYEKNGEFKREKLSPTHWQEYVINHLSSWKETDLIEESAYRFKGPKHDSFHEVWNTKVTYKDGKRKVNRI